jgi:predicted anti-sigma-YlaC factor YlaD
MTDCEKLRARLDDAVDGRLDAALTAHLARCPDCREMVERATIPSRIDAPLRGLKAPTALVARLKRLPRLDQACEQAQTLAALALEGEIEASERDRLIAHLHDCRACRAAWDAVATLREVGSSCRANRQMLAALAMNPRRSLVIRRRLRFFDLRLATAAAYLLAALTVALAGNPVTLAREGGEKVGKATFFAAAAVENRADAYGERIKENVAGFIGWVENTAQDGWTAAKRLFGTRDANQPANNDVVSGENGGSR